MFCLRSRREMLSYDNQIPQTRLKAQKCTLSPSWRSFSARGLKEIRGGTKLGSGWYNWGEIRRIKTFLFNSRKIESRRKLRNIRYFRYKTVSWCWLVPYRKSHGLSWSQGGYLIFLICKIELLWQIQFLHILLRLQPKSVLFWVGLGIELGKWQNMEFSKLFVFYAGAGSRVQVIMCISVVPTSNFQCWSFRFEPNKQSKQKDCR